MGRRGQPVRSVSAFGELHSGHPETWPEMVHSWAAESLTTMGGLAWSLNYAFGAGVYNNLHYSDPSIFTTQTRVTTMGRRTGPRPVSLSEAFSPR